MFRRSSLKNDPRTDPRTDPWRTQGEFQSGEDRKRCIRYQQSDHHTSVHYSAHRDHPAKIIARRYVTVSARGIIRVNRSVPQKKNTKTSTHRRESHSLVIDSGCKIKTLTTYPISNLFFEVLERLASSCRPPLQKILNSLSFVSDACQNFIKRFNLKLLWSLN